MRKTIILTFFVAAVGVLGACTTTPEVKTPVTTPVASPSARPAASPAASPSVDPRAVVDSKDNAGALEGRWPGVEGAYLNVAKKGDKYAIEIKNLDKPETFEGTAKGGTIEFTRKGKTETIKTATGDETGMKWLAGEKNCVVINKGSEGYCKK